MYETQSYYSPGIAGSGTSAGGIDPAGGTSPPAGTQVNIGGKIYEFSGTPGIAPHLVGDAPAPPWESEPVPVPPAPEPVPVPPAPEPVSPAPEPWPRYEFPQITTPTFNWSQMPQYQMPAVPTTLTQPITGQVAPAPQFNDQPAPAPAPPPRIDWMAEAQKLLGQADIQDIIRDLETNIGPIRNTLSQLLAISPEDIESRYQAEVATPAQRYYEEQTLPSLRKSFVGPGTFWSSMRGQAEERSGARLGEALMGERSRMYGQARQEALGAAGQAQQLEQQAFAGRTYPYEMALKGAPLGVEQRGQEMAQDVNLRAQNLQQEYQQASLSLQARAQDLESQLAQSQMEQQRYTQAAQLGYMSQSEAAQMAQQAGLHQSTINLQLEQLKQRERELWGYLNPLENSL